MDRRWALAPAVIEGERLFPKSALDAGKQRSMWIQDPKKEEKSREVPASPR